MAKIVSLVTDSKYQRTWNIFLESDQKNKENAYNLKGWILVQKIYI